MGPLNGRPAWNEVAPPNNLANMIAPERSEGWAGSAALKSNETPQRADMAPGGMTSAQTNLSIKGAGTRKSQQTDAPADPNAHMLRDGGKY